MLPSQNIFNLAYRYKIPLSCTFEITNRCNLKCRHCYREITDNPSEMTTGKIKDILVQLRRAGNLYLVFTGGEIFLRKDILELCEAARDLHFDLRLFTNATLINVENVKALAKLNLSGIEISLYGKKSTHDWITKVPGSFDKTIASVKMLTGSGIPVIIKCPLMKQNIGDYQWLKGLAKKLKVILKADPTITPKNNGDKSILRHRLNSVELKNILSVNSPLPLFIKEGGLHQDLLCSAGHNLTAIGHDGRLYPCLQLPIPLGNLNKSRFSALWNNKIMQNYRQIKSTDIKKCPSCNLAPHCQRCPGLAMIEDGDLLGPSRVACQIAKIHSANHKY